MSDLLNTLGSTFRRAKITAGSIAYSSGAVSSLELPNTLPQKGITLRLTGNLVIATANATVFDEAPLPLIKNIQVIGDGRRILFNGPGSLFFRLAHVVWGKQGELIKPSGTVGTRAFSAMIRLDHEMLEAMDPVESLFDPRLFKKVELKVLWGAASEIATAGGGGTIAISSCSLDVLVDQTSEGLEKILFDRTATFDERAVVATSSALDFDVPQNGLLIGMLLCTTRDLGAGAGPSPVDDLVNSITLKSDQTVIHISEANWKTLQAENVQAFGLDGASTVGDRITGYAYVPLIENGMFSSALNTNALNALKLLCNVTRTSNTETIRVLYVFAEPRQSLAAALGA